MGVWCAQVACARVWCVHVCTGVWCVRMCAVRVTSQGRAHCYKTRPVQNEHTHLETVALPPEATGPLSFSRPQLFYTASVCLCVAVVLAFGLPAFTFRQNLAATALLLLLFGCVGGGAAARLGLVSGDGKPRGGSEPAGGCVLSSLFQQLRCFCESRHMDEMVQGAVWPVGEGGQGSLGPAWLRTALEW